MKLIQWNSIKTEIVDKNNSVEYVVLPFYARQHYSVFSKPLKMYQIKQPMELS